ncbi:MAG: hypothetical protein SWE60_23565 [Thermodesulfobacteriota bacterium]|nr:hypothetical protein [Thermodesulfobacteriota bacterium]
MGENISFFLREKVKRQDHIPTEKEKERGILGWNQYDYIPTGNLVLGVDVWLTGNFRKTWAAGSSQRVENMLNDFVVGLIKIADIKRQNRLEREERERRRFEEQKRREELERERLAEAKRRSGLENQARRWNQSKQLRAYIEEVHRKAKNETLSMDSRAKLEHWLNWATEHADRLDPLKTGFPFETSSTEQNEQNDPT